jgi:membrane-anchored protein YejM (alkaline phosphatase superfamily)
VEYQDNRSFLFITLDSCRYDTFVEASTPNLKGVGKLYRANSQGNFTYSSHAAMFMGFTPGIAKLQEPYVNPKYAKIFKLAGAGFPGKGGEYILLKGASIIDGFRRMGYYAAGTGAVGWFDPQTETGKVLTQHFEEFYFPGNTYSLQKQMDWLRQFMDNGPDSPLFLFLNIGETHVPYYYDGAPWDVKYNPCVPFSDKNDARECRRRQLGCLEYVDKLLGPLLERFKFASTVVCSDHGDCWGEDGLWEHGIHHEKIYEVPLVFRLAKKD